MNPHDCWSLAQSQLPYRDHLLAPASAPLPSLPTNMCTAVYRRYKHALFFYRHRHNYRIMYRRHKPESFSVRHNYSNYTWTTLTSPNIFCRAQD
jgi:hypothetical protein